MDTQEEGLWPEEGEVNQAPDEREAFIDWSGQALQSPYKPQKGENPCLVYGFGPKGVTCKKCIYLNRLEYHGKTYRKCEKNPKYLKLGHFTHGSGTDHRAGWPCCRFYVEEEPPAPFCPWPRPPSRHRRSLTLNDIALNLQRKPK